MSMSDHIELLKIYIEQLKYNLARREEAEPDELDHDGTRNVCAVTSFLVLTEVRHILMKCQPDYHEENRRPPLQASHNKKHTSLYWQAWPA